MATKLKIKKPRPGTETRQTAPDPDQSRRIAELEQELKSTREALQTTLEELEAARAELKSANESIRLTGLIDITNRKQVEEEAERTSATLQLALEASNAGLWDWNIVKNTFHWSEKFLEIFGMETTVQPGFEAWAKVVHPEDREMAAQRIQEAIDEKKELVNDYRIVWPNREIRWIRAIGKTLYDDHSPVRMIGLCIDITDRKRAEEDLKVSEEKFSRVFHHAPLMMTISDLHTGTVIEVNQKHLDVFGYTREEVIGKTSLELNWISPDDRARLAKILQTNGYAEGQDLVLWTKDHKPIPCLYSGFLIDLKGESQIVSINYDITGRKQAEEKIRAGLREREVLLRELSHRTKNNMFVIHSMLALQASYTRNEEVKQIVRDVENKIFAMALVHQKLYQTKNLSRIDLAEYLEELSAALVQSYTMTPANVSTVIEAESISVLLDTAIPCGLVFTELISNIFKHAFPDNRTGEISIRLFKTPAEAIHLRLADNGVGIPNDFDFRHQKTLGLRTIFMIVEHQMKGTIHFSSNNNGVSCDIEFSDTLYTERV